ncbi:ATP-binding protein [Thiothrix nivea]|uniref:Putative transcriptional regulator n=1 Tax=Thiothrix nivea (strain ATCC 35100 / DSM 5205 / JP2) TaxID=870187 RepID=A0A656HFL7_THINJ|nr:ATP-binding protein [Thiothrix nivea]EIJ34296.1 putative transcriptional regulator [Thiothrix nivea DSM 5205]
MRRDELQEILANGENSGVEFKRDDIRPEQLAREIVALANFQGGRILLGVEDDGSVSGIRRGDMEEWVMNVFRDKVHPMMLPFYEEIGLSDGKRVAVVSFTQGISKPYVVRHAGREDIYLRVGSTSQLATREQQARLYALGGMLHTEVMPVPGTSMAALDKARLQNYLEVVIADPEVPQTAQDWEERLLGLGFLVKSLLGEVLCTIAGLVLFGVRPRRYLRQAGIRAMVFEGSDKAYQARLDEVLDMPLVGRIERDRAGNRLVIEDGLVEKLVSVLRPFIFYESGVIDENSLRRDRGWMYPLNALREVVINACAHRDWTRFVDIEVGVYADRLEVVSPGALQNSMTIEKMKAGQRSPRNPIIVEVLRDYGYVDARGMGIRTKVIPQMRAFNGTEPEFEATEDYLKTTLRQFAVSAA